MANNRMYLVCTRCVADPETTRDQCLFFLAKYYPSSGWYIRGGKTLERAGGEKIDFVDAVDQWFDEHKHGGMYGEYIYTCFESGLGDPLTRSKREILDAVTRVANNVGGDRA